MRHVSSPVYWVVRTLFPPPKSTQVVSAAAIAMTLLSTGCITGFQPSGSSGSSSSAGSALITTSPQYGSVPINGSITLTATVTNSGTPPTWQIVSQPTTGGVGALSSTSGYSVTYTAPSTTPIYGPLGITDYSAQSSIVITATPSSNSAGESAVSEITITAPSISTGIAPTSASVALGATVQFYGYAVGDTNKLLTFEVNGVAGGTTQTGTITNAGHYLPDGSYQYWGLYTAPTTMPTTGNVVTITVVSQADPSKSSSAVVTLN